MASLRTSGSWRSRLVQHANPDLQLGGSLGGPNLTEDAVSPGHRSSDGVVGGILAWWSGARTARDELPWRATRDPWCVLVAEMMLAQTQVARVADRYREFIKYFPSPSTCANATLADVLRVWVGLGYNRRARWLHETARAIVEKHNGKMPSNLVELLALNGIGPYTARAVLAFSLNENAGVVDTNVGRVLARAVVGQTLRPRQAQAIADALVPNGMGRDWNLALMDFGSLVCTSRSPKCSVCILKSSGRCAWQCQAHHRTFADPARGSAGVSVRQARFAGSDRQGRGRLVRAACDGPLARSDLAVVLGWPDGYERAERIARGLIDDGLLLEDPSGALVLP